MATFTVTTLSDVFVPIGQTSLRDAVAAAEANAEDDTIVFDAFLVGGSINLIGALTVSGGDRISIIGDTNNDGLADITLSGRNANEVLVVGAAADVALSRLILADGRGVGAAGDVGASGTGGTGGDNGGNGADALDGSGANGGSGGSGVSGGSGGDGGAGQNGGEAGGAVRNYGNLSLDLVTLRDSTAIAGEGGIGGSGGDGGSGGFGGSGGTGSSGNSGNGGFGGSAGDGGSGGSGGTGGTGGRGGNAGGAIFNAAGATLSLTDIYITGNQAYAGRGGDGGFGGIGNNGGSAGTGGNGGNGSPDEGGAGGDGGNGGNGGNGGGSGNGGNGGNSGSYGTYLLTEGALNTSGRLALGGGIGSGPALAAGGLGGPTGGSAGFGGPGGEGGVFGAPPGINGLPGIDGFAGGGGGSGMAGGGGLNGSLAVVDGGVWSASGNSGATVGSFVNLHASGPVFEGQQVTIYVNRYGDVSAPLSLEVQLLNGYGINGEDFPSGVFSNPFFLMDFAAGQFQKTIVLDTVNDAFADGTNVLAAAIVTPGIVTGARSTAAVVIFDDEVGTPFADTLNGSAAEDSIDGLGDADVLRGNRGNDTINGGEGGDTLYGGEDQDNVDGGGGDDRIYAGFGNDSLNGGGGTGDIVELIEAVGATFVTFSATAGAGNLSGSGLGGDSFTGVEKVYGGNFVDTVTGSANAEYLVLRVGNDVFNGNGGGDTAYGGDGADTLNGGEGGDTLHGENGQDTFGDGGGLDRLFGGAEQDRFNLALDNAIDTIDGGADRDILDIIAATSAVTVTFGVTAGSGAISGGGLGADTFQNIEIVYGSNHGDTVTATGGAEYISGRGGGDTLRDGAGADTLLGDAGNDQFIIAADGAADSFNGGGDSDILDLINATGNAIIAFGAVIGAGTIAGGGFGADTFTGVETMFAGNFIDTVTGGGGDEYFGLRGGNDIATGGGGADRFHGGLGQDRMGGGAGLDTYLYFTATESVDPTRDIITDWDAADIINLAGVDANDTLAGDQQFTISTFAPGTGQMRIVPVASNGTVVLQLNTDADAAFEMVIQINTTLTVTAGDFVL